MQQGDGTPRMDPGSVRTLLRAVGLGGRAASSARDTRFRRLPTNTAWAPKVELAISHARFARMARTLITKSELDSLIRMHLENLVGCGEISAMPVVWRRPKNGECNWAVPGWTGESESVHECLELINAKLRVLRGTYDIPDEG